MIAGVQVTRFMFTGLIAAVLMLLILPRWPGMRGASR